MLDQPTLHLAATVPCHFQDNNGTREAGGSACSQPRHCLHRKRPQGRIFGAAEVVAKLVESASS
jgi:hypothetical protein